MRSSAVDFQYNDKNYKIIISFDEVATIATLMHNTKTIIMLTRDSNGSRPAPVWKFESDFTTLLRFIDNNKDDITKYKKLYEKNKNSTKVANWFKNTPISDIEKLKLNKFMDWFK